MRNKRLEVYIKRNVYFIHSVYFSEAMDSMQYRTLNAYQEVSNINHFVSNGTVIQDSNSSLHFFYSLGRLVVTGQCRASS